MIEVGVIMNDILKTISLIHDEDIQLCPRCQGRLFGKLGYNLTNIERGITLHLMLQLKQYMNEQSGNLDSPKIAHHTS